MLAEDDGLEVVAEGDPRADITVIDVSGEGGWPSWDGAPLPVLLGPIEALRAAVSPDNPSPAGFLLPESTSDEIAAAVRAVHTGLVVMAPAFAGSHGPGAPTVHVPGENVLTPREAEVLLRIADGLPNKAIAFNLGISENTVKFHVSAVLSKLSASSRAEAVAAAVRGGYLPL
jgi:DNA-binding CsgD family transcriptional regulator